MACKPPDLSRLDPSEYYLEGGNVVFTEKRHLRRGHCCGMGCRHCPFHPTHEKGVTAVRSKVEESLDWVE